MRHALGVLGVLAAGVLLAVSAAMNWRFGYSLGKTEFDGLIYGSASAAADCLKALLPFFFFAAWRNRMWSQAAASALVWVVVTAYSLTSALGHAALNRMDTTGQRAIEAQSYKDLRADLKRAQEQLSWVPQHRPPATVQGDIDAAKSSREWSFTKGCTSATGPQGRKFCQEFHTLSAELASAEQASVLEARIAHVQAKLGKLDAGSAMAEADPQAAVLTKLAGVFVPNLTVEDMQTALSIFIALLLEVGSGFGMFIAFSQWRLYDREERAAPAIAEVAAAAPEALAVSVTPAAPAALVAPVAAPLEPVTAVTAVETMEPVAESLPVAAAPKVLSVKANAGANDNKTSVRLVAPETDVERFFKERIDKKDGSSVTSMELYEDYCTWCEDQSKEPLALPTFCREFGELGVQKAKIAGRVRHIGIAFKLDRGLEEDKKLPASSTQAA